MKPMLNPAVPAFMVRHGLLALVSVAVDFPGDDEARVGRVHRVDKRRL